MQVFTQSREQFNAFIFHLMHSQEVIAPVEEDVVRFKRISKPAEISLKKQAWFPAKEFFFKKKQTMFLYIGNEIHEPRQEHTSRIFFGLRKCDLNAIHKQDNVYMHDVHDPYYIAARENATLIGYHCETPPSEYCFCGSMDLKDYHDLMYYERGDHFLVEVGSEKGHDLVKKHPKYFDKYHRALTQAERTIKGADRLKRKDIKTLYNSPDWEKGVSQCLSCGACTTLCPTCYCFEIHDEPDTDNIKKGKRERSWSSCMLQEFTRVAGNHIFRKERDERFKHRIYHQLQYYKEKYGEDLCVGCGRCITGCPTRIDFVKMINEMP